MNIFTLFTRKGLEQTAENRPPFALRAWLSEAAKRGFDVIVALLGLVLFAPLFALVALLIKLDTPGPVFYRGARAGRYGKNFDMLKFRTMFERPESYQGPQITANGDSRITPLGRWLRDTKVNELPQLCNVLVGEMSLVGPRPETPEIVAAWPADARAEILSVRPGITSPTSVAYHDEESRLNTASVMDDYLQRIQPDKMRLDRLYVRHHSFLTDLDAIFWTLVILVPSLGERKIPEGWLFGGPLSRFQRSYLGWFVIDFFLALASVSFVGFLWRISSPLDVGLLRAAGIAVVLAFLFGLFNTLLGVRNVSWSHAAAEDVLRLFISAGLVIVAEAAVQMTDLSIFNLPVAFVFSTSLLVLLSCVLARYRFRLITGLASRWITLRQSGYGAGERVLIVGAGDGGSFAAWLLRHSDFQRLYTLVGVVDDDPAKQGLRFEGLKVLGTPADIPELVAKHDIGVIFFAIAKISSLDEQRILAICRKTNAHIVNISNLMKVLHDHLASGLDVQPDASRILNVKTQPNRAASSVEIG
jgi:lipopolysaccharide/colanic/teichoic acid biosynthesis glycosyltransferase